MPIFIGRLLALSFSSLRDYTCDSPSHCLEFLSHVSQSQPEWPLLHYAYPNFTGSPLADADDPILAEALLRYHREG